MKIDAKEFKKLMEDMGELSRKTSANDADSKSAKVQQLLAKYDENNDGVINWSEFINMIIQLRGSDMKFG